MYNNRNYISYTIYCSCNFLIFVSKFKNTETLIVLQHEIRGVYGKL